MIHKATVARPQRRREARAEAILDAAMGILAREGVASLTLQRVGKEIDVVPAALYRYFASKDALLAALQRRTVAEIHERLRAHIDSLAERHERLEAGARSLLSLLSLARFYAGALEAMPESFGLVQALLADPRPVIADDEASASVPLLSALLGEVGALFEAATASGVLPAGDAAERTLLVWATLHGLASFKKLARFDPRCADTAALGERALAAMLSGLGAAPAALRSAERALT